MIPALPSPVLSVTPEVVRELDGREAVSKLWTLFTKCKESLENGRRLENISWRLWYRDFLVSSQAWQHQREHPSLDAPEKTDLLSEKAYHPPTPIETAVLSVPSNADVSDLQLSSSPGPIQHPLVTSLTKNHETDGVRKTLRPLPVGRIICDMLPSPVSPPLLPAGSPSFASISITASTGFALISRSPRSEPFARSEISNPKLSPSGVPLLPLLPLLPLPEQIISVEPQFTSPSQLPTPGVERDETTPFGSAGLGPQQSTLSTPAPIFSTSPITPPSSRNSQPSAPLTTFVLPSQDDPLPSASNTLEPPVTPTINETMPVVSVVATPPRLVVVNPTPGPTPHPTPPATPLSFLSPSDPGKPRSHGQFLAPPSMSRRAPSNQLAPIPAPVFDPTVLADVVDVGVFNKIGVEGRGGDANRQDDQPPVVVDESGVATLRSRSAIHDIAPPATGHTAFGHPLPHSSSEIQTGNTLPSSSTPSVSSISRSTRLTPPPTQDPTSVERPSPAEDVEENAARHVSGPSHHPHRLSLSSTSTISTTGTNTSDTSSSQISLGATSVNTDGSEALIKDGTVNHLLSSLQQIPASQPPLLPSHPQQQAVMGTGISNSNTEVPTAPCSPVDEYHNVASPISPTMAAHQQQLLQGLSTSLNSVKSSKSAKSTASNPTTTSRASRHGRHTAPGLVRRASSGATGTLGGRSRRAMVAGGRASSDTSRSRSRETGKGVAAAAGALAAAMGMAMTGGASGSGRKKLGGGGKSRVALARTSSRGPAMALTRTLSHEDVMEVTEDDDDGDEVEVEAEGSQRAGKEEGKAEVQGAPAAGAASAVADSERKAAEGPQTRAKFKFGSVSDDGSAAAAKSMGSGTEASFWAAAERYNLVQNSSVHQAGANQMDTKGKGRETNPQQVEQQSAAELENQKAVEKQRQRTEAEAVAKARAQESLGAPLLPQQGKRTILLTSESDYTDTDDDSWTSEDGNAAKAESSKPPPQTTTRQTSHTEIRQAVKPVQNTQQHPPAAQRRPQLQRTQSNTAGHNRPTRREMQHIKQREEAQLRIQRAAQQLQKEEEEKQRQKEMFAKRPTSSFQNLANARTQSFGLLSQLMNPDPTIFPPNHPYRRGHSSGEIQRTGASGLVMTSGQPLPHRAQQQQQPLQHVQRQEGPPQQHQSREQRQVPAQPGPPLQQRQPGPPPPLQKPVQESQPPQQQQPQQPGAQRPAQDSTVPPSPVRSERRQPSTANPAAALARRGMRGLGLPVSKTSTAGPVASQVVAASVKPKGAAAPPSGHVRSVSASGVQRQKGPLPGQEMDTDSEDENEDNSVPISQSVAQHRLQVFAARRGIVQATNPLPPQQEVDGVPPWVREQQQQQANNGAGPSQQPAQPAGPIPMMHPYNLPINAMPLTPRTTRLQMLRNEMPESLRRQLLWERQQAGVPIRRTTSTTGAGPSRNNVLNGLKPLTTTPSMVQLRPKGSTSQDQLKGSGDRERRASGGKEAEEDMAEKRRKAMARNRSWADTYHTSGW